jgi:hypothetical protein
LRLRAFEVPPLAAKIAAFSADDFAFHSVLNGSSMLQTRFHSLHHLSGLLSDRRSAFDFVISAV